VIEKTTYLVFGVAIEILMGQLPHAALWGPLRRGMNKLLLHGCIVDCVHSTQSWWGDVQYSHCAAQLRSSCGPAAVAQVPEGNWLALVEGGGRALNSNWYMPAR